jgi:hypothetical protein
MFRLRTSVLTGLIVGTATYGADLVIINLFNLHDPWSDRVAAAVAGFVAFAIALLWKFTVNSHAEMVEEKLEVVREVERNIRDELNVITLTANNKRIDKAVHAIVNELDRLTVAHEVSATLHALLMRWARGERRCGSDATEAQAPPTIDRRAPSRAAGERKHVD